MSRGGASAQQPSRRLDRALVELRQALRDHRVWNALGRVWVPPGEADRFEADGTDVRVFVQLIPSLQPVTCRMCAGLAGVLWIPPTGSEVAVMFPGGRKSADGLIVACLSTQQVSGDLDGATVVVTHKKVRVRATAGDVNINASGQVKLQGGGPAIGRVGDAVQITMPVGSIQGAGVGYDPTTHLNIWPISIPGTITSGSGGSQSG